MASEINTTKVVLKVNELQHVYDALSAIKKYKVNFEVLKASCLNLLRVLKVPAEEYFTKYFLCGEEKDSPKLSNVLRARRAYRNFLRLNARSFSTIESFEELCELYRRRAPIQRFNYLQGFVQNKYRVPIYLSTHALEVDELSTEVIEDCISVTRGIVEMEEVR